MVYFSEYTAQRVKLASSYVEVLRHKWRDLSLEQVESLLDEIGRALDVSYSVQEIESSMNDNPLTKNELKAELRALRRAKVGL